MEVALKSSQTDKQTDGWINNKIIGKNNFLVKTKQAPKSYVSNKPIKPKVHN